jgi:hypothetical protein
MFHRTWALVFVIACSLGGGGLSSQQLEQAKSKVYAMQPAAQALEALAADLGAPHSQDEGHVAWTTKTAGSCKELRVHLMGEVVGQVEIRDIPCS